MYKQRKINIVGLFLTLILGLYIFVKYQWVGFPDGHYTEYDRFSKTVLYPLFFLINTPFAIYFLWSLIKRKGNNWGILLYLVFIVIFGLLNYYFSIHLENGQGG